MLWNCGMPCITYFLASFGLRINSKKRSFDDQANVEPIGFLFQRSPANTVMTSMAETPFKQNMLVSHFAQC